MIKRGGHAGAASLYQSPLVGLAFWQERLPVHCSCASIIAPAEEPPLGAPEVGRTHKYLRQHELRACQGVLCVRAARMQLRHASATRTIAAAARAKPTQCFSLDMFFVCSGPSGLGDCRSSRACTQAWPTQSSLVGGAACWAGGCLEASGSCTCTALVANPSGEDDSTAAQQHGSKAARQHTAQQAQQSRVGACFLACSRGHIPSWAGCTCVTVDSNSHQALKSLRVCVCVRMHAG